MSGHVRRWPGICRWPWPTSRSSASRRAWATCCDSGTTRVPPRRPVRCRWTAAETSWCSKWTGAAFAAGGEWREAKVAAAGPLGPETGVGRDTARVHLCARPLHYAADIAGADRFFSQGVRHVAADAGLFHR